MSGEHRAAGDLDKFLFAELSQTLLEMNRSLSVLLAIEVRAQFRSLYFRNTMKIRRKCPPALTSLI